MPCRPAKARHLLNDGKADVKSLFPFTVRLKRDCEENIQSVTLGIDKGSHQTGFSCAGNSEILLSGMIEHRTDIKKKMDARRANRRARRNRKRYRPARFDNRGSANRSSRLPPSVRANADEVVRVVRKIPLPVSRIVIEDVQIDIARLNNVELNGKAYQESGRLCENLRMAALMRDGYKCQSPGCRHKNRRLEAHHIIHRKDGGKDTVLNLITLCDDCHDRVHDGKIGITGGVSGFEDCISQRTMQGKAYMYEKLEKTAPLVKVFGYQTSAYRKSLNMSKEHDTDALCIALLTDKKVIPHDRDNFWHITFRAGQTRRIYRDLPWKGKGRVKYQVNGESGGFRKGDTVLVRGKWIKQINSIYSNGQLAFERVKGEPCSSSPGKCRLLKKCCTMNWKKGSADL